VDIVRAPKQARQEATPPTLDEAAAMMRAASSDKWSCLWLIVLALGLRRGEALGLRWADVDFDKGTIQVRAMIQRQRGELDPETGRRTTMLVSKGLKTARVGQDAAGARVGARGTEGVAQGWRARRDSNPQPSDP
jgi:integrase